MMIPNNYIITQKPADKNQRANRVTTWLQCRLEYTNHTCIF